LRLTVFTTNDGRLETSGGTPAAAPPPLSADRDERLGARDAALEDALNDALARETTLPDALLWVEVGGRAPRRVRLAGCTQTPNDKALAEDVLRRLLVRTTLADAAIANDIVVDPWR
jgi:hypothetical protein